jgi:hypothetical protein
MHTPERHVVMSFVSADDATAAVLRLHLLGLPSADVASYTPGQMRARAASVLGRVCPPTPPGLEPELVATQRELARLGHSFVLVRAGREALLPGIRSIAAEAHAHSLQTSTGRPPAAHPVAAVARFAVNRKPLAAGGRHPVPWSEESRPSVRPDR